MVSQEVSNDLKIASHESQESIAASKKGEERILQGRGGRREIGEENSSSRLINFISSS
jgi:hypothetical protein